MALLQITEPGMSTEPHQHLLAVGIDLGTTNSLVATVRNGIAICLPDEPGRTMLPSAVRYHADGGIEVGLGALKAQAVDPRNTIVSVKRFMGRGLKDVTHIEAMPYDFEDSPGMGVRTVQGVKSPVEVSAEILRRLRAWSSSSPARASSPARWSSKARSNETSRRASSAARKSSTRARSSASSASRRTSKRSPRATSAVSASTSSRDARRRHHPGNRDRRSPHQALIAA